MFIDARQIDSKTELMADLCIIGAGAAGITLASELNQAGFSTILLEAGGTEYDDETQAVYEGVTSSNVLPSNYLSASRLRFFGGTTNHWGGHSVVMNSNIFRARPGVPGLEWPIKAEDLRPYYKRAAELLGMRKPVSDRWEPETQSGLLPIERYPAGEEEMRLGPFYFDQIKRSDVRVLLNASVTAINPNPNGKRIDDVRVQTLAGNSFSVRARSFVLAAGAIENARLLLLPTHINKAGIGNDHDLVGRNFSDHLYGQGRLLETRPPWRSKGEAFYTLTPELQDKYAIPELGILRLDESAKTKPEDAIMSAIATLADGGHEPHMANLIFYVETMGAPENRVTLSPKRDPFGNPRSELRFNFTSEMRETYTASTELFARISGQHGIGRVQLSEEPLGGANHHMNTTRMSDDPTRGVVDSNGRVHGVSNLFAAGSSVFPSNGCGNPTFPLIALTARLADHLSAAFRHGDFDG